MTTGHLATVGSEASRETPRQRFGASLLSAGTPGRAL
jgi:hypothetical protein